MDYEKKYKEALERAKSFNKRWQCIEATDSELALKELKEIFPELGESEDEKIKKGIIDFLWKEKIFLQEARSSVENNPKYRFVVDAIAWLEKQKYTQKDVDNAYLKGITDTKNELEKQGEQKPQGKSALEAIKEEKVDNANKVEPKDYSSIDPHFFKPTEKVEPKFEVGEWVVFNCQHDSVYQVEKIENYQYTLRHILGGSMPLSFSHEDMIMAWTIQDAKDGDVLKEDSCIFIIERMKSNGIAIVHCCLFDDGDFDLGSTSSTLSFDVDSTYPATKEQRDLLFTKMKEAGYEWDANKKEIRKTCQKPNYCHHEVDETGWTEEYRKAYYDGWNNCNQQHAQLEAQRKPTWSEEDAKMFDICCDYLDVEKCVWLKSLKQRLKGE